MKPFKFAVALTGGIATGKSSVVKEFIKSGFRVIDADSIAHISLDAQYKAVEEMFGSEFVNQQKVNRKLLGKVIFSNPSKLKLLEDFLHPIIHKEIEKQAMELDSLEKPYIVDIPLFFETNNYPIERSILVYTTCELQLERLMKRNHLSQEEANLRIASQMSFDKKKEKATYILDNSGDRTHLKEECARIINLIKNDIF